MPNPVDEHEKEKVAPSKETPVVEPKDEKPEGDEKPKVTKLELTTEELQARIQSALDADREAREKEENLRKAKEQGDLQALLDAAEKEKLEAKRELWVEKALNKYQLSEDWTTLLVGDTREAIMALAKKIRNEIDTEVTAQVTKTKETEIPPDPGKVHQSRKAGDVDTQVRNRIKASFGIGQVLH